MLNINLKKLKNKQVIFYKYKLSYAPNWTFRSEGVNWELSYPIDMETITLISTR